MLEVLRQRWPRLPVLVCSGLMDEDLMRMKSFIETGRAPHDAADRHAREAGAR